MNTAFRYVYRDGSNYKNPGKAVFSGTITNQLQKTFAAALDEGSYFIAEQVGVPEVFFIYGEDSVEDDHCWHEFSAFELTHEEPTDARTIQQFVVDVEPGARRYTCASCGKARVHGAEELFRLVA